MDYDRTHMPSVYDAGRGYAPETLHRWLAAIEHVAGAPRPSAILDLGCGTGRFAGPLAAHFNASVIAIDPSEKMLAAARQKKALNVTYLHGAAENLPLTDEQVDMVFMSMVFHHFSEPDRAARECARVLTARGTVVMRTGASERIEAYPYVAFFPRSKALLGRTFGSIAATEKPFLGAGFARLTHEVILSQVSANWADYAEKVSLRTDSILVQLDDEEFAEGLAKLRVYAAGQSPTEPVIEPVDLLAFRKL